MSAYDVPGSSGELQKPKNLRISTPMPAAASVQAFGRRNAETIPTLRVRLKTLSGIAELSQHEADGGALDALTVDDGGGGTGFAFRAFAAFDIERVMNAIKNAAAPRSTPLTTRAQDAHQAVQHRTHIGCGACRRQAAARLRLCLFFTLIYGTTRQNNPKQNVCRNKNQCSKPGICKEAHQ